MKRKQLSQTQRATLERANWLRAAVLGANDGIVSIAGLVVGVAGATSDKSVILTAGVAGILAGALSMAAGEYVSVSTQRDIEKEHHKGHPEPDTDVVFTNPWQAAGASLLSFIVGSAIPFGAIMLPLGALTVPITFIAVVGALALTGYMSASLGGTKRLRATLRVITGGALAMLVTYGIGTLFGVTLS